MSIGVAHPEWVAGKRLWLDPMVKDLIDRIQNGDPVLGWEGDPNIAVYTSETPDGLIWELFRLEDDNEYRFVVRTEPGIPFDVRVIHWLIANDKRRKAADWDIFEEITKRNQKRDDDILDHNMTYMREEVAPRLRHALKKDGY